MSFGSTLVAIVAIVAVYLLRQQKLRREGYLPDNRPDSRDVGALRRDDDYTRGLEREVVELRKRVEVLERIATDDTRRLSAEIEQLRDREQL